MQNMPIAIFRGDDTDALGYQTIVGTIKTDLDLAGCKAVFRYLSFSAEFDPIPEDKKLTVIIPASETKKFPPGLGYASLRVYDAEGKLCTFSNRIMVFVATKTPMFGNEEFEVDFNVRPELEPLKIFVGPNPDDFDEYRGFLEKVIDRASAEKYGLAMLLDAIDSDLGADDGVAATPAAVKAAYAAAIRKLTDEYYDKEQTDGLLSKKADEVVERYALPSTCYPITFTHRYLGPQTLGEGDVYFVLDGNQIEARTDVGDIGTFAIFSAETLRFVTAVTVIVSNLSFNGQDDVTLSESDEYGSVVRSSLVPAEASSQNQLADKRWVDGEIDSLAAYYITYTAAGAAFPTYAALANAQTVYSGGVVRTPTRNDYAVVLADESHDGAEYRYIYAVAEGQTVGQWEPQYPIETNDYAALTNKPQVNGNTLTGNKTGASLGLVDASNGVATGLVTYLGTYNGFEYGLRFGSYGSDYAVQIVARSAGSQVEWTATANLMVQKSKTGYAALLSDIPSVPNPSTSTPLMDGTGSTGSSAAYARGDHVHPSDSAKLDKSGGGVAKIEWVNSGQSNATLLITFANNKTLAFDYDGYSSDTVATRLWIAAQGFVNRLTSYFTPGNLASLTQDGGIADSGVKASDKLDASSASAPFSSDSSVSYPVGSHCTYNGKLYICTTATTGGTWVAASWTAEDMTTPDATLDVTATDKLLRLVATNGDVIWGQGYNLSTTSSATVLTEQVSAFTFAADAAADQAIVLPSVAASKVGDFILDVTNLSANDRSLTLTGLDSAFSVVVKAGDDLSETLTVAAGEMARYYFTMTAFRVNSLPTWQVAKEAVENGGAQS